MGRFGLVAVLVLVVGAAVYVAMRSDGDDRPAGQAGGANAKEIRKKRAERNAERKAEREAERDPVLPASTCPPELSNCVVASGRVIYVEAVDPDGDGDAHFVTISKENVTGAGMTVFDVRTDLRPDPLPEAGDIVGGAGPVYTGSHGQKQIEVIEFHVAR
ncbi:MAG: hypothetical protein M3Y45_04590 [Actinomycetota bacterium]|nr:hypothetical protein [Actinomycetota bacterium]